MEATANFLGVRLTVVSESLRTGIGLPSPTNGLSTVFTSKFGTLICAADPHSSCKLRLMTELAADAGPRFELGC